MEKYETFSTTADVGIRVQGRGNAGLLQSAVNGLNLLYFDSSAAFRKLTETAVPVPYPFKFSGDGIENILVNLLAEVVYLLQTREQITLSLNIIECTDNHLNADLLTTPCPETLTPETEIKSVTYHNLKVQTIDHQSGTQSAQIIFDV